MDFPVTGKISTLSIELQRYFSLQLFAACSGMMNQIQIIRIYLLITDHSKLLVTVTV